MASVQPVDRNVLAPAPRSGPPPPRGPVAVVPLGADHVGPSRDKGGLLLGGIGLATLAVQFVPGVDVAVDVGAAAAVAARVGGAGEAAAAVTAGVEAGGAAAAKAALPGVKRVAEFLLHHLKGAPRDILIGIVSERIAKHLDHAVSGGGEHGAAELAAAACASGHVASAHVKDATADVTLTCR